MQSGFVDMGSLRVHHMHGGRGSAVVFVHGLGSSGYMEWRRNLEAAAARHRVFAPDLPGYGRTDKPRVRYSIPYFARFIRRYIEDRGLRSVALVGTSLGGRIALEVALEQPKLVRKLVWIDQYVTLADAPPGLVPFLAAMSVDTAPPPFVELYGAVSPDGPGHFGVVLDKLRTLWTGETGVDIADLEHVVASTLLLAADDGGMTLEHLAAARRALPDAQVAVVPGTSHGLVMEKPHVVNQLLLGFLADEQVPKLLSYREGDQR